ncbi:MAG: RNA methyltransferase [Desulfobacteraceae bacterium]|nr:RNA methyltransferase [Desulfobacteraceae bacterium]
MATYSQIQEWVKEQYGFTVKTCWIAHVKEMCGLKPRVSPNRKKPNQRVHPCPPDKEDCIKSAFKNFGMIKF